MADSKISALPASTTPLAGTEVLPIVQSSATKQVSVANLTAGRAISATQLTLTTGNLIVASGQGIDFSATSGTGTSELLADYEEGTWTATVGCTGNGTTTTTVTGYYTKVGRKITVSFRLLNDINTTGLSGDLLVSAPFACISGTTASFVGPTAWSLLIYPVGVSSILANISNGSSSISFITSGSGIGVGSLGVSALTSGTTDLWNLTLTYFTA